MNYFAFILSFLFFPQKCVMCGSEAYGIPLCRRCRSNLDDEAFSFSAEKRCRVCGKILLSEKETCLECRRILAAERGAEQTARDAPKTEAAACEEAGAEQTGDDAPKTEAAGRELPVCRAFPAEKPPAFFLDGIYPVFNYIGIKKKLLFHWKIAGVHPFTEVFAPYFISVIGKIKAGVSSENCVYIVPVPPRPGKIRKTGWDQTESIAKCLEKCPDVRVIRILKRTETVQQKKLNRQQRLQHSGAGYSLNEKAVNLLFGGSQLPESVVLIDDIITTGSTLKSCASVLKNAGIQRVSAVTLFTVPY